MALFVILTVYLLIILQLIIILGGEHADGKL